MKKRNVVLISSVVLAVLLVVGGTMAWFTSNSYETTNTFKAGTVDIDLLENDEVTEGRGINFDNVNPGDSFAKKVEVRNNGSKRIYVRVKVEPAWSGVDSDDFNLLALNAAEIDFNTEYWIEQGGYFYYKYIVEAPKEGETGIIDPPLFTKVTFKGLEMGNEYQGSTFIINLQAQAVQASHYAYKDAWKLESLPEGVQNWEDSNSSPE